MTSAAAAATLFLVGGQYLGIPIATLLAGAGIGGLTAGALLTKQGYNVKIFEKESIIGGRALSFDTAPPNHIQYKDLLSRFHMQ